MNKNKKTTWLPKLRFPEFVSTGEWQGYKLDEIADRLMEKVGNKQLTTLSISAGVGFVSQAEKFSRDISGKQYENYIILRKGDFSYNKGNSKKFPQGCIYELKEYDEAAVPNAFISFHFNNSFVSSFYKGYFESNFHGKQLKKFITSGARSDGLLNINPSDFFSIILPTPREKEEQQKIADCLSSLDDLITAEGKKLDAFKAHKKGLLQKLFPADGKSVPEWRFSEFKDSGEWTEKELGEIGNVVASGDLDKALFSSTQSDKYPFPVYSNSIDGVYGYYSNGLYPKQSVTITARGTLGVAFVRDHDFMGIGRLIVVTNFAADDANFVKECWNHMAKIPQEVTSIPQLTAIAAKKVVLLMPQIKEQQKISDCLSSIDTLIIVQAEKIEALKLHKKGLMQGLFPSIEEVGE